MRATDFAMDLIGDPITVRDSRRFTVVIHTANLTGLVTIEATLSASPSDGDWFPVSTPLSFPLPGQPSPCPPQGQSFIGNFAAIRARLTRPGFETFDNTYGQLGYVDRILMGRTL